MKGYGKLPLTSSTPIRPKIKLPGEDRFKYEGVMFRLSLTPSLQN